MKIPMEVMNNLVLRDQGPGLLNKIHVKFHVS